IVRFAVRNGSDRVNANRCAIRRRAPMMPAIAASRFSSTSGPTPQHPHSLGEANYSRQANQGVGGIMSRLARLSLANRGLVALIAIIVTGFGLLTIPSLKQQLFPSLDFPAAFI